LDALRQEVARLSERVALLEAAGKGQGSVPSTEYSVLRTPSDSQPRVPEKKPEPAGLSEELILVISAASAAFLGKKAPIRQIRLPGSAAWAQEGRVTIQASHALSAHHG